MTVGRVDERAQRRDRQRQTETDRDRQRQTETDRDRQQTESKSDNKQQCTIPVPACLTSLHPVQRPLRNRTSAKPPRPLRRKKRPEQNTRFRPLLTLLLLISSLFSARRRGFKRLPPTSFKLLLSLPSYTITVYYLIDPLVLSWLVRLPFDRLILSTQQPVPQSTATKIGH
jgi:hypothetical protein